MSFVIRPAVAVDAAAIAAVHTAGFHAAYDGLAGSDWLAAQGLIDRTADWAEWLASGKVQALVGTDGGGAVVGFAGFGPLRTPPPGMSPIRPIYTAEIYALYLLPTVWRQGLGGQLMAAAATTLHDQKHKSLCLWVMEGNKRAVSFYKKKGGQKCGTKKVDIGGRLLPEAAFGWRDTQILR